MPWIWLTVIVVMSILELATIQFVSIWFVVGAIGGLILSVFGLSILFQVIAFIVITITSVVLTRPLVKKIMNFKKEDTNLGRYINKTGMVIEEINNNFNSGQVKVSGLVWTARSEGGDVIKVGEKIKVTSIDGVKLNVVVL